MLTQARLKELLDYNSETGEFFWRKTLKGHVRANKRAGHLSGDGYWIIGIDGKQYRAHRLAWLYMHGCFPKKELDHKNRNRSNGCIGELREANRGQNRANSKLQKNNRSGFKGVYKDGNSWKAEVKSNGTKIYLGMFKTPEAAHAAYCRVAEKLHGEFFCPG